MKEVISMLLPKFVQHAILGNQQTNNNSNSDATTTEDTHPPRFVRMMSPVCVIFCDIANFDEIIETLNTDVISLLD